MRKSNLLLYLYFFFAFAGAACLIHSSVQRSASAARLPGIGHFVARAGLTDICLFNDARYTRHLSQADRHAAFQDHPGSLDHFPSGSIAAPPFHIRGIK